MRKSDPAYTENLFRPVFELNTDGNPVKTDIP